MRQPLHSAAENEHTDVASIDSLFAAHYPSLVRLVAGLLDDDSECEEVVQDAFAGLIEAASPPAVGRELAYLRVAVLNGARSRLRRRGVRRRFLRLVADDESVTDASDAVASRVDHQRVLDIIRSLPDRQAEVLLLRFQADLSEAEIADTLGISTGSVKTHAHRGVARVRDALGGWT